MVFWALDSTNKTEKMIETIIFTSQSDIIGNNSSSFSRGTRLEGQSGTFNDKANKSFHFLKNQMMTLEKFGTAGAAALIF